MNFNSIGGRDYSQAGKAVANDAIRSFAASRRNSPNFGKMAQEAANIRSNEKRAMTKLAARTAVDGINAKSRVAQNEVNVEARENLRGAKRKAGVLAAGGKFFGQASTYMGEKRKKRTVGDGDDFFDNAIEKVRSRTAKRTAQFEALGGSNTSSSDSSDSPSSSASPSAASTPAPSTSGGDGTYDGTFQSVYSMAQRSGAKFPELVAAQWQLESAGGTALSGTNNFFGIKAAPGESGTVKSTWEEDSSGNAYDTSASFKNFDSPQASVDHLVSRWHQDYNNYRGANNSATAADAARYLRSQGYATDSKYADKLIDIMSRNGF